ncbi:hypothetical protein [Pseudomonas aeruginosa]|nr:hypothetical protein [Pseudomonas aeruginosa]MEB5211138.1 hypothetical protein [Pseudomonas aeruginosa]MEB5266059.1 hypothetical protein [Pseudomonas aeruginosa]
MPRIALVLGVLLVSACAQPVTPDSIVEESFPAAPANASWKS